MDRDTKFTLVKASKSRPSGEWSDDDYDVRVGDASGEVIERIFRNAATREDAMANFKLAWSKRISR